jgi:hypothetical protein
MAGGKQPLFSRMLRGVNLQAHHRVHNDTNVQIRRYQMHNPDNRLVCTLHLHNGNAVGLVPIGKLLVQHEQGHLRNDVDALLCSALQLLLLLRRYV